MDAEARLARIEGIVERIVFNRPRLNKALSTLQEAQAKYVEQLALREAPDYIRDTRLDDRIDELVGNIDEFIRKRNERNT
jgi:hypothetical protein